MKIKSCCKEYNNLNMNKINKCENCKYYEDFAGVCCNADSDFRADFVDEEFSCNKWKERSENEKI